MVQTQQTQQTEQNSRAITLRVWRFSACGRRDVSQRDVSPELKPPLQLQQIQIHQSTEDVGHGEAT